MLGSVFNQHQTSTSSQPSRATLRSFRVGEDTCPFSELRGLGPPGLDIGLPGDIYIDITPGLHALYARYPENWLLWPGPKDASTRALLLHPRQSGRCLWCLDSVGWFLPRNIKVSQLDASELLSKTLACQARLSEESKKRKRDAPHQPIRPRPSSSTTNSSSPSRHRNSLENQSPTDAIPRSHRTHEIIDVDGPTFQNSEYGTRSPSTDLHQSSISIVADHISSSNNHNERSDRNLQERHTSSRRIDLRKVTRPTHARSILSEEQSLLCQSSIYDSETSRIFRKDDASPDQSTQTNSAAMFREHLINNTDLQTLPAKPISFNLSDMTGQSFVTNNLHHSVPFASTDSGPSAEAIQGNKEIINIAITQLRKIKDASDANAANLQVANDKIHLLEAENAKLRAQLLSRCRCNSPSFDIPLTVEIPPAAEFDALNDTFNADKNTIRNVPSSSQFDVGDNPCEEELESDLAPKHSTIPSTNLSLVDTPMLTETTASVRPLPAAESNTLEDEVDISSNVNTYPLVREEIVDTNPWHAPSSPTPTLPRMREIHRSLLFAKAGSLLICRICLGTKSGGTEIADQAFQTSEDSPELIQEHWEKEHPNECEALISMKDEDLIGLVSMITSERVFG